MLLAQEPQFQIHSGPVFQEELLGRQSDPVECPEDKYLDRQELGPYYLHYRRPQPKINTCKMNLRQNNLKLNLKSSSATYPTRVRNSMI
jgi:hypothetical protein